MADLRSGAFVHREGTYGTNREGVEPRRPLWAVAEVSWQDARGIARRAPATLEDTSPSGACVRVGAEIAVGANLIVKWHREQFSGVARNRRQEGREFLIGIQKTKPAIAPSLPPIIAQPPPARPRVEPPSELTAAQRAPQTPAPSPKPVSPRNPPIPSILVDNPVKPIAQNDQASARTPEIKPLAASAPGKLNPEASPAKPAAQPLPAPPQPQSKSQTALPSPNPPLPSSRRSVMQPTPFFSKLLRHQSSAASPESAASTEAPMNKPEDLAEQTVPTPRTELLPCDDIYRASGILAQGSRYDIAKIVEMLNSKHIRELPRDVKRASVLMALDAAGTPVDEVLNDAARRQHALNSYESAQQKQFEQFEADKIRENAQIKIEMERVAARYAERIQHNLDHVAREREAFLAWQAKKNEEIQRITEAVSLCGKQPVVEPAAETSGAFAKAAAATTSSTAPQNGKAEIEKPS